MSSFVITDKPTPLLNTPDFTRVFQTLPLDDQGLLRELEMIALPGTKFKVLQTHLDHILEVFTLDYPYQSVYLDERFVSTCKANALHRLKTLPSQQEILENLHQMIGLPYIWGGNWSMGVPEIFSLYSPKKTPFISQKTLLFLRGVDCSGLLYEVTNGFTPRNTSSLMTFGEEILSLSHVKPLDIIVWPGHVVIVLDPTTRIESIPGKGVILTPLMLNFPKGKFVIRRFIK